MKPTSIEEAHRFPIPMTPSMAGESEKGILIRYDGFSTAKGPTVLAVISVRDLALVGETLDDILPDGALAAGSIFFRRDARGGAPLCYVNTNRHDDFLSGLTRSADAMGVKVFNAVGDLKLMMTLDGTFNPPSIPAFAKLGLETVKIGDARQAFTQIRRRIEVSNGLRELSRDLREMSKGPREEPENVKDNPSLSS